MNQKFNQQNSDPIIKQIELFNVLSDRMKHKLILGLLNENTRIIR